MSAEQINENDENKSMDEEPKKEPLRYNMYAGLKGRVSVRTMDIIIFVIATALVTILFIGVFGK